MELKWVLVILVGIIVLGLNTSALEVQVQQQGGNVIVNIYNTTNIQNSTWAGNASGVNCAGINGGSDSDYCSDAVGSDPSTWNFANNDSAVLDNKTIIRQGNTTWVQAIVVRNATLAANASGIDCARVSGTSDDVCTDNAGTDLSAWNRGNFTENLNITVGNITAIGGNFSIVNIVTSLFLEGVRIAANGYYNLLNFTTNYDARADRFSNENFTVRYDLRIDRYTDTNASDLPFSNLQFSNFTPTINLSLGNLSLLNLNVSGSIKLSSLTSQNCIGTDSVGLLIAGTCGAGSDTTVFDRTNISNYTEYMRYKDFNIAGNISNYSQFIRYADFSLSGNISNHSEFIRYKDFSLSVNVSNYSQFMRWSDFSLSGNISNYSQFMRWNDFNLAGNISNRTDTLKINDRTTQIYNRLTNNSDFILRNGDIANLTIDNPNMTFGNGGNGYTIYWSTVQCNATCKCEYINTTLVSRSCLP